MPIRAAAAADVDAWLALRAKLWPLTPADEHRTEIAQHLADPARFAALLACDESGRAPGFAEAALRADHVNGCETSPVAFLEGIDCEPQARRQGLARALAAAVEGWAVARGCRELPLEALIENNASHDFIRVIGFAPTESVVFFHKEIK